MTEALEELNAGGERNGETGNTAGTASLPGASASESAPGADGQTGTEVSGISDSPFAPERVSPFAGTDPVDDSGAFSVTSGSAFGVSAENQDSDRENGSSFFERDGLSPFDFSPVPTVSKLDISI